MTMRNLPALHGEAAVIVGRTLVRQARGTRKVGAMRWHVPVPGHDVASVWLDGEWLCVESEAVLPADDWDLLRRNATLPPALKLGRRSHASVLLCGEIRIDTETAAGATRALLAGLRAATGARSLGLVSVLAPGSDAPDAAALAERIAPAGWESVVRAGTCVVAISARAARYEATLAVNGGIHGEIELARFATVDGTAQAALAHLLLCLCGRLRGVSACILDVDSDVGSRVVLRALSPSCGDVGVVTVLESLSAACVLFGREVTALAHDVHLARAYQLVVHAEQSNREPVVAPA